MLNVTTNAMNVVATRVTIDTTAEESRATLNTGLSELRDHLGNLATLFDLTSTDLPIIPEQFNSLFELSTKLDEFAQASLPAIDEATPIAGFSDLAAQIDAISGFSVVCHQEELFGCAPGDIIQVQIDAAAAQNITASSEFDDQTTALMALLTAGVDLDGTTDLLGDLTVDLIIGVDASGFYLSGGSVITLSLTGDGLVSDNVSLNGTESSVDVSGTTSIGVAGPVTINVRGIDASSRHRAQDIATIGAQPSDVLSASVDGILGVAVTNQLSPLPLSWPGEWTFTISNNTIATTEDVTFPSEDLITGALLTETNDRFSEVFDGQVTDQMADLLESVKLPLTDGTAPVTSIEGNLWFRSMLSSFAVPFDFDFDFDFEFELNDEIADVLVGLGYEVITPIDGEGIANLLTGNLGEFGDLFRLKFNPLPDDFDGIGGEYEFNVDDIGALGDLSFSGQVSAELRPLINIEFGIDANGFFFSSDS